jgi:hypothetical protein
VFSRSIDAVEKFQAPLRPAYTLANSSSFSRVNAFRSPFGRSNIDGFGKQLLKKSWITPTTWEWFTWLWFMLSSMQMNCDEHVIHLMACDGRVVADHEEGDVLLILQRVPEAILW